MTFERKPKRIVWLRRRLTLMDVLVCFVPLVPNVGGFDNLLFLTVVLGESRSSLSVRFGLDGILIFSDPSSLSLLLLLLLLYDVLPSIQMLSDGLREAEPACVCNSSLNLSASMMEETVDAVSSKVISQRRIWSDVSYVLKF